MGLFDALLKPKEIEQFVFQHASGLKFVDKDAFLNLNVENCITISQGKHKKKILETINYGEVIDVILLEEIENNDKNKSIIGRAIVGGLLLGPVGAVVGGMSGTSKTKTAKSVYYLQILAKDEKDIILKPAFNSSNIAALARNKIIEKIQSST